MRAARLLSTLGVFLGVYALVSGAVPAEAQLGGLMRKAREAAKEAPKDPRSSTPAAATSTQNPFADPAVVFITQEQLGRFDKALRFEIAKREELKKSLAGGKTPEEYNVCSTTVATSKEMQQIVMKWSESAANMPPDQMAKAGEKMQADVQALTTKHCGVDPNQANSGRADRIRAIENEASVVAMPPGWTPPAGTAAPRAYAMFKERIPVFCAKVDAKAALTPTPVQIGGEKVLVVKIPGSGPEYVFRQDEAEALTRGCSGVMTLINSLFDTQ
jgi:hypothetical protein